MSGLPNTQSRVWQDKDWKWTESEQGSKTDPEKGRSWLTQVPDETSYPDTSLQTPYKLQTGYTGQWPWLPWSRDRAWAGLSSSSYSDHSSSYDHSESFKTQRCGKCFTCFHRTFGRSPWPPILFGTLAVTILVAVILAIAFASRGVPQVKNTVSTMVLNSTARLPNQIYTTELEDPTSSRYQDLAEDFCRQVDRTMIVSNLTEEYNQCTVTAFREGSVIVTFSLTFITITAVSQSQADESTQYARLTLYILSEETKKPNGYFEKYQLHHMDIVIVHERNEVVTTEKPIPLTTTMETIAPTTTIVDTVSTTHTTVLPTTTTETIATTTTIADTVTTTEATTEPVITTEATTVPVTTTKAKTEPITTTEGITELTTTTEATTKPVTADEATTEPTTTTKKKKVPTATLR